MRVPFKGNIVTNFYYTTYVENEFISGCMSTGFKSKSNFRLRCGTFWLTTVFYRVEVWYRIFPCLGVCDNCIASDLRWETKWVSDLTWCALIKTRSVAHFSFRLSYFLGLFENFDLHEVISQQYGSKISSLNYHVT